MSVNFMKVHQPNLPHPAIEISADLRTTEANRAMGLEAAVQFYVAGHFHTVAKEGIPLRVPEFSAFAVEVAANLCANEDYFEAFA